MHRLATIRKASTSALFGLAILVFFFETTRTLLAQNPNSGVTSTGQTLTVNITDPLNGTEFPGPAPCAVDVTGLATIDGEAVSILYVIDLSASTHNPNTAERIDVNGDGIKDDKDDFNGDGEAGLIIDAEIAAGISLNSSIANSDLVSVGVIGYASEAAIADVGPATGDQSFTSPPLEGGETDGESDIEEVLRSMESNPLFGGGGLIGKFTRKDGLRSSTNYEAALQKIIEAFEGRTEDRKIVFFLSDGITSVSSAINDEIATAVEQGIVINTILMVNEQADSTDLDLKKIADSTGGEFVQVEDLSQLVDVLPNLPVAGISVVTVNGVQADLSPVGTFTASINLDAGANNIAATATADDQTQVTATIDVFCQSPECAVTITRPANGETVFEEEVAVEFLLVYPPGFGDNLDVICEVTTENGKSFEVVSATGQITSDSTFIGEAVINCVPGENIVSVFCSVIDRADSTVVSSCSTEQTIFCKTPVECEVKIETPANGETILSDSVFVTGVVNVSGGIAPSVAHCVINGVDASITQSGVNQVKFEAKIACSDEIIAECLVIDPKLNIEVACSDTITVSCQLPDPLECQVQITSPEDGSSVNSDSLTVTGLVTFSGGIAPSVSFCTVNGKDATITDSDSNLVKFEARLACQPGDSLTIDASCIVFDPQVADSTSFCSDRVTVFCKPPDSLECAVEITSPQAWDVFCSDSVVVEGNVAIEGAAAEVSCDVNGLATSLNSSNMFSVMVPLLQFKQKLIATCTIVDDAGVATVCKDSIKVIRDDRKPVCDFEFEDGAVVGTFIDEHSGIASIIPVEIRNGTLTVESFDPGRKKVDFRIDVINPDKNLFFSIDVFDMCGNRFNCDPVYLSLNSNNSTRDFHFTFPSVDRYFEIENHGISAVTAILNGHKFNLFSDAGRAFSELNAYAMPNEGKLTLDLQPYLKSNGLENEISISFAGLAGTTAQIMIAGEVGHVDHVLDLADLPRDFGLAQNYPNPFNPSTKIRMDVPDTIPEGVVVKLRIYNLLGALVRELVSERKLPGQYTVEWDGRDDKNDLVSSGVYIYQLKAGDFKQTRQMLLMK